MIFKMLEGFDAKQCGTGLYNAGLFNFGFPPRDLSVVHANWVIVMSRVNPGPLNSEERDAFGFVIEATAEKYGDVLVRDTPGDFWGQGTVIPVTEPPVAPKNAPGIRKFISGAKAIDCATTLLNSFLIAEMNQNDSGYVEVTSRHELDAGNADQARDFNFVVKAVAEKFDNAQVTDVPPELF
jgi:hypothetical protein